MASFTLRGRSALVTGASSGIGLALARALARHGVRLAITARRTDRLLQFAAECAAAGHPVPVVMAGDLARPGAPEEVFAQARAAVGPIEILVNNAGFSRYGAAHTVPVEVHARILRVNVEALVRLSLLALPEMIERRDGAILQMASTAAFVPLPYMATYTATKAFVVSFSEALHAEVKPLGVRVVCLCPGRTAATEFFDVAGFVPSALFGRGRSGMTADAVAAEGIAAIISGEPVRSAGMGNRLMVGALRLIPRRLMLAAADWVMRPRE
jgi:short-subunit dehydrogenase